MKGYFKKSLRSEVAILSKKLPAVLDTVQEVINQTKDVLSGNLRVKDRIISIYDKDAKPIKRAR